MTGELPARVLGLGSGWGPALRIARRELLRAKGRTVLVLLMVLLPVTAVIAVDTLLRTTDINPAESVPRELGDAQARVEVVSSGPIEQSPDMRMGDQGQGGPGRLTARQVQQVLAPGSRLDSMTAGPQQAVRTSDGRIARVGVLAVDLRAGAVGPLRVLTGRAPRSAAEVVVSPRVAAFGFPVGSSVRLAGGARTVVGTFAQREVPSALETLAVAGLPEAVGITGGVGRPAAVGLVGEPATRYYVSGPPVTWQDVRQLNALGALVLSRAVLHDPPPDEQVPDDVTAGPQVDATAVVAVGLVVVIAVLEVVLLAGPAFAVGARRQRRALALMAAGGAEPRHLRRVVLAQGLLIGGAAALGAAVLGLTAAAVLTALVADDSWGPFEVGVLDVVLLCLLGAGTALLAALVPAVIASRQPVVAALQGRRVVAGRAWLPSTLGVSLLAIGVACCAWSVWRSSHELLVAFSAVPTVLGAALLAPAALALVGRVAGRLPLPLRYAVRDADRQRGRTAPAVAAVTATVAAVVVLGVTASSDAREEAATHISSGTPGVAVVRVEAVTGVDYALLARAAGAALPDEPVRRVPGVAAADVGPATDISVCRPDEALTSLCKTPVPSVGVFGVLVGVEGLDAVAAGLTSRSEAAARQALAAGGDAVAGAQPGQRLELRRQSLAYDPVTGSEDVTLLGRVPITPVALEGRGGFAPVQAVVSAATAARLGGETTVGMLVGDDLRPEQVERLQAAVQRADTGAYAIVQEEAGPVDVELLLLGGAVGFLVLAGTLVASSLALTEARPDLATLGSLGAPPRTRRTVAAAYAYVLALVGAVLGCLAGLVPGVAAGAVSTRYGPVATFGPGVADQPGVLRHVDVPWLLLLGLVVVLPLLTAAVAGLTTRSQLPALGRRVQA